MEEKINQIESEAIEAIKNAKDLSSLDDLEKKYIGRRGKFRELLQEISQLPEKERPKIGQLINQTKKKIEQIIENKKIEIRNWKPEISAAIDITLPGEKISYGHLHRLRK